ncbi:5-hydroxytryptamine receptor [Tribolium castaneum]|uniref:Serotonin receptor type 1 n=1 Tax=Tribolium castaneum TaxID=7070 RepID=R9ULB8_TRICA|nr:5-hydroxytryptamine receptor [Tribolium castaneum]AGN56420.1 serotonin receptor type 1 [Tribolium castaneum]|eukprot:NP_001280538.1 5-hydroxytryptamine receptor [Tribolium castaneum]
MGTVNNPSCSWGGSARATIFVIILPAATSATSSDLYHFPGAENATSMETLYEPWNCTKLPCNFENGTLAHNDTNDTLSDATRGEPLADLILMGFLSVVLGLMILVTVIGNVFVIAAILLERNLQNVANYLIVSLAVADLMVACLVMPLGAVYAISNNWIMGPELCDMWTSIDVLCCTASILHLVAIALDRYWAVTNVDYIHTRNSHRIGIMIVVVWSIALVVSLAPQIPQFKDPEYLKRIQEKHQCLVSQDLKYQIFATSSTFYVPLLVIFVLYWKIFQTARKRIRRRREMKGQVVLKVEKTNNNSKVSKNFLTKRKFLKMKKCSSNKKSSAAEALVSSLVMMEGQSTTTMEIVEEQDEVQSNGKQEETTAFTITKPQTSTLVQSNAEVPLVSNNVSPEKTSSATTNNGSASHQSHISDISRVEILNKEIPPCPALVDKLIPSRREKKESLEAKRERKAAKTLAIITGAFVMCWLPFFILALLMPLCGAACTISEYISSFALWLGYFNSTLNPVIYTIFNPEFRQAFKRILCGGHSRGRNFRSGKIR